MRLLYVSILTLLLCTSAWAAGNEPVNPLPASTPNSSSYNNTRTMLQDELPDILGRYFPEWVRSGGLHPTAAGCTSDAFSVEAFTNLGNRVTTDNLGGSAAIDYSTVGCNCNNPGTDTAWVIASAASANVLDNFQRVLGTNYFVNCVDTAQPTLPADTVLLFTASLINGAITAVTALADIAATPMIDARQHLAMDGVTDDSAAFIALLTRARGRTIKFPAATCKIGGSTLTFTDIDVHLIGDGIDKTILDMTSFTNSLLLQGSMAQATTTSGAITQGDRSFTVTSTAGIAALDWIVISDPSVDWNISRPGEYTSGEWVQVMRIDGTTLYTSHPMHDSYQTGISVWRFTHPMRLTIKDLTMRFNANIFGLRVRDCLDCVVENVRVTGARLAAVKIVRAPNLRITRLSTDDAWFLGTTQSYGLELSLVHNALVTGSSLRGGRHAITTGHGQGEGDPAGWPNRRLTVTDSYLGTQQEETVPTTTNFALDLHGNSEFVNLTNNHVDGGIELAGDYLVVTGNIVNQEPNTLSPSVLKFREMKGLNVDISHNIFIINRGGGPAISLGTADNPSVNRGASQFRFAHNTLRWESLTPGNWCLVNVSPLDSITQHSVHWNDNQFFYTPAQSATAVTTQGECRLFSTGIASTTRTIHMNGNTLTRGQLRIDALIDDLHVIGNTVTEAHGSGISILTTAGQGVVETATVTSNMVRQANSIGISIVGQPAPVSRVNVVDNITVNNGQDAALVAELRSGIRLTNLFEVTAHGNNSGSTGGSPQQYGIYVNSNVGSYRGYGNFFIGNGTAPELIEAGVIRDVFITSGRIEIDTTTFSGLGATNNATILYCADCVVTSGADNTCAAGVGAAFVFRIGGVNRCFALQN